MPQPTGRSSTHTATEARRERLLRLIIHEGRKSAGVRELAALLTAEGHTCSHTTVENDLKVVRAKLVADTTRDASEWVAEQLRDLDALYADLWPNREDPRVTVQLMKIMERRAKLLGLDSVQRVEVSGPNGNPVAIDLDIDPILRALSDRATGQD
jgi:hypothetical protein